MQDVKDKNQMCFVVWSDEIEGRFDPFFYKPEFLDIFKNIKINSKKIQFSNLIKEIAGGATPKIEGSFYTDEKGIPFLRVQNITEEGINLDNVKYIKNEVHEGMLRRSQLKSGDLVFTITGRVGNVAVVPENFTGNINQHSVRIRLKDSFNDIKVNPFYIAIFFNTNLGNKITFRYTTGGTRPALDYEAIRNLPVILPPLSVQNRIVEIMESAYKQKKEKEAEAEKLLNSIDDYVLEELGIKMPEIKNKMCFVVDSEEVKGSRLDSYYYQPKFKEVEKALEKGKYKLIKINQKLKILTKLENISKYDVIKYIDLASINKDLGVVENYKELKTSEAPSRAKQKVKMGDLLLSSLQGSLKSIAVIEDNFDNIISSTGFYVVKKSEDYNNYYLWAIFRSLIYQILLNRIATGAIMSAINREDLLNLKIPLPPLEIQNKIANEVKSRIERAKKLKEEAKNIIENAKKEVEKIILGK